MLNLLLSLPVYATESCTNCTHCGACTVKEMSADWNPTYAYSTAAKKCTQGGDILFFKFAQRHDIGRPSLFTCVVPEGHHWKWVLLRRMDMLVQLLPFAEKAQVHCGKVISSLRAGPRSTGPKLVLAPVTSETQCHQSSPSSLSSTYQNHQLFLLNPVLELWVLWAECLCPPKTHIFKP